MVTSTHFYCDSMVKNISKIAFIIWHLWWVIERRQNNLHKFAYRKCSQHDFESVFSALNGILMLTVLLHSHMNKKKLRPIWLLWSLSREKLCVHVCSPLVCICVSSVYVIIGVYRVILDCLCACIQCSCTYIISTIEEI